MTPAWQTELQELLKSYYIEESTYQAVLTMYQAIDTAHRCLADKVDYDARLGVLRMLIDLTYGLEANPFMMMHRFRMWPLFQAAVNAFVDSLDYADEDASVDDKDMSLKVDLRHKAIATQGYMHEVALMALLCEQGAASYRVKSKDFRNKLLNIKRRYE